jgi:homoserine kinase
LLTGHAQIFNLQRLAVLTTALTRSPPDAELIYQAMQDKVHQPYRKTLVRLRPSGSHLRGDLC